MANTVSLAKVVYPYVLKEVSRMIKMELKEQKLFIGNPKREKKFDGVSEDRKTILSIFTSSGYSQSGKLPSGKINAVFATCFMMMLTGAERKVLVFTDAEFFGIMKSKGNGFLNGFELLYVELPEELKAIISKVSKTASEEMA